MRPKTAELLYYLLWTCDMLMKPTFRNLTNSFESWAYRNGFDRQLAALERQKLLESDGPPDKPSPVLDRAFRLTETGRLLALGGRDPEERWGRQWDGRWRLVLFDLPNTKTGLRNRLRRQLRQRGFGYLQNSVWISPDPLEEEKRLLAGGQVSVESLILLESRPCAGESNEEIVAGAWDFEKINRLYARHAKVLAARPKAAGSSNETARNLRRWAGEERVAWWEAVSSDPLLPALLLPAHYAGREAWRNRVKTLRSLADRFQDLKPEGKP
jgi:phenylacetic acid degradation operon negative regulatory protein